jgi:phosphoribosylanthranilate isomerase
MILWPKAKRAVSVSTAAQIAAEAVQCGARPVAVFVDETADTIIRVCSDAGISTAQLHGDGARASLPDIPPELEVNFVATCSAHRIAFCLPSCANGTYWDTCKPFFHVCR